MSRAFEARSNFGLDAAAAKRRPMNRVSNLASLEPVFGCDSPHPVAEKFKGDTYANLY